MKTTIEFIKLTLATVGTTILLMFAFGIATVEAKTLKEKNETFCLPSDVSKGFGCVWKVGHRTKGLDHQIQIVSSEDGHPVRDGNKSIRFEVRPGECWGTFNGTKVRGEGGFQPNNDCERDSKSERAEIWAGKYFGKGERWYAWSIFIPEGQEIFNPASLKMGQFHSKLYKKYIQHSHFEHSDGKYTFHNNLCDCGSESIDPVGKWTDILIHVNWSPGQDGFYKIWADGKMVMDRAGPTMYEKKNKAYVKIGIYRNGVEQLWNLDRDGGTTIVYYDNIRTGKTMDSVIGHLNYEVDSNFEKDEIQIIEEKIAELKLKQKDNYDIEVSREIVKLKKKLKRAEYEAIIKNKS